MSKELQVLNYNGTQVRTVLRDDGIWWVLTDVCTILGLSNSRIVSKRLDEDEKGVSQIYTLGGNQEMTIISESGLYNVILRSNKPEAKQFKRWVTHDVLPQIRKHGSYSVVESARYVDVPVNPKAQELIKSIKGYLTSVDNLLTLINRYSEIKNHNGYTTTLKSMTYQLFTNCIDLSGIKVSTTDSPGIR